MAMIHLESMRFVTMSCISLTVLKLAQKVHIWINGFKVEIDPDVQIGTAMDHPFMNLLF